MAPPKPHERILDAAIWLFAQQGIAAVGVGRITVEAGVAQMTLYRHFGGKDEVVAAALERWSIHWLQSLEAGIDRFDEPVARFDALWDVLEEWFRGEGNAGSFVANAAAELRGQPGHPAHLVIASHRAALQQLLENLAKLAGALDPADLATQLQVLIEGAAALRMADRRMRAVRAARGLAAAALSAASA
ncbi:MAG TPA: helix-turn-helix domain-containing protein [Actinomycetes bacterium]